MCIGIHVKSTLYAGNILMNLDLFRQIFFFFLNTQIPHFMEIRPMGAWMFYADRWANRREGHDETDNRFSQICGKLLKMYNCLK